MLCKHMFLNLKPQYTHMKLGMVTCLYNLTLAGRDNWIQRAFWSSSLAKGTSFQFSEKSFFSRSSYRLWLKKTPSVLLWPLHD